MMRFMAGVLAAFFALSAVGCRSMYYSAWETLGKHKRDLLRDNVEAARDDQKEASEQFKDALTRLKELYQFEGGELEAAYNRFKTEYDRSVARAESVRSRIGKVEQIAADLFSEWEREIEQISNARLQSSSRKKLDETRTRFEQLHTSMLRAEEGMEPVLTQLQDQVLYLKHNLNAQAIGALRGETLDIEREIQALIQELNTAISQADAFINTLPE